MKVSLFIAALCVAATPVLATTSFFDDFENGVRGSIWTKWTGSSQEILQTSTSHNHTAGGSQSALGWQADPTGYSAYADFGTTADFVRAEVYVFEDHNYTGTQPTANMLCLIGDTGGTVGFGADYLQLGSVSGYAGGAQNYSFRTLYGDSHGGTQNLGVSRKAGWTKLAIEADPIASGGQVRFYIDDVLMPITSLRTATNLRWVRLGINSKNYENFWYDDVKVTPEPASLLLLGLSLFLVRRRAR
jgi:hypothetical protein